MLFAIPNHIEVQPASCLKIQVNGVNLCSLDTGCRILQSNFTGRPKFCNLRCVGKSTYTVAIGINL